MPTSELISNAAEHPTANRHASPSAIDADWSEPQPFYGTDEPVPYPIDALPNTIRAAVEEVHGFVQAPIELIALSAVGALALAGQAQVDVKRAEGLSGPTGLFLLGIAESGERKSTCDRLFTGAIEAWQKEQLIAAELELEKYRGEKDVWEAERKGLQQAIQHAAKNGRDSQEHRKKLEELHRQEPKRPHTPRILLADETPENLAYRLAHDFPYGGVISAEGGLVLGAQAMKSESIMRHLSVLNILWDGGSFSVGRKTSDNFEVGQARLTVSLQLQGTTLRAFQKTNGELARGIGFLARFLVCHPFSTQGSRMFVDPPAEWTKLNAFNSRITEILALPLPLDEDGLLRPIQSSFDEDAKAS